MKTKLLLLIFLTANLIQINAQIGFQENIIFNPDSYISIINDIKTADLDNDGDEDIIISSAQSDKNLVWYENLDGFGDFGSYKMIADNPYNYTQITTADIDKDGFIDIITQSRWYKNNDGNGTFEEKASFADNDINSESINMADIDGDGDLDILLNKTWYENTDGVGNFVFKQKYKPETGLVSSSIGDLDGDGDLDIAMVNASTNRLAWFENLDGLGNFGAEQYILSLSDPRYISVNDMDGDTDMDIVTVSVDSGRLIVHKNLGDSWDSQTIYTNNASNYRSLNVTDIDGDGDIDISISFDDANYRWYQNNGSGFFQYKSVSATAYDLSFNTDIDGDNDKDFIAVNCGNLDWVEFPNVTEHYISTQISGVHMVAFSDIDNDGDLDVVSNSDNYCNSSSSERVVWYENIDGYIDYKDEQIVKPIGNISVFGDKMLIEDFNNDGAEDVFVLDNHRIFIFKNDQNGDNFTRHQIIVLTSNVDNNSRTFDLGDMDSDGDIDVISYYNGTAWFENIDGDFSTRHTVSANKHKSLFARDVDGDGDNDIVYAHSYEIGWYENIDGQGAFSSSSQIGTISIDKDFTLCQDIDKDNDIDIVTFDDSTDRIILFENLGGSFSSSKTLASSVFNDNSFVLTPFILSDLNNDGYLDIVCSSYISNSSQQLNKIYWFNNTGSGNTFGEKKLVSYNDSKYIDSGDFDNDGDIDLVSGYNDRVIIYKNLMFVDNKIHGTVNYDINGDGCLSGNYPVPKQLMITADNGNDQFSTFTQDDGNYQLLTNEGSFNIDISTQLPNYLSYTPSSYNTEFVGLDNVYEANFCIQPLSSVNDLNISIYPLNDARPGFDASYRLVYRNVGTTQLFGTIVFEFDSSKLTFLSSSEAIESQSTNSIAFNYFDLNPFETRTIDLNFNVLAPPTTNIDDILNFKATINPISGDNTENDNVFELNQTVIGSYDPNDILVLEGNQILIDDADEYLHYIIRFQNTGTADAINVRVDNILDDKLDWTTMQLESSNHSNRVEIRDGNKVSFIFDGIYLPDSTNDEPNSHGFIAYKIKPISDVIVGDILPNQADIFFDFNPAITTNMVTTEITNPLSTDEYFVSKFYIYPNPTTGTLNINSKSQISNLEIYNNVGQKVLSNNNKKSIDVSSLSTGLYFIKIKDANGALETKKFVKN